MHTYTQSVATHAFVFLAYVAVERRVRAHFYAQHAAAVAAMGVTHGEDGPQSIQQPLQLTDKVQNLQQALQLTDKAQNLQQPLQPAAGAQGLQQFMAHTLQRLTQPVGAHDLQQPLQQPLQPLTQQAEGHFLQRAEEQASQTPTHGGNSKRRLKKQMSRQHAVGEAVREPGLPDARAPQHSAFAPFSLLSPTHRHTDTKTESCRINPPPDATNAGLSGGQEMLGSSSDASAAAHTHSVTKRGQERAMLGVCSDSHPPEDDEALDRKSQGQGCTAGNEMGITHSHTHVSYTHKHTCAILTIRQRMV